LKKSGQNADLSSMRNLAIAFFLAACPLAAQQQPEPPRTLPGTVVSSLRAAPQAMPREEGLVTIDQRSLRIQHLAHRLVITNNNRVFREFNPLTGDEETTLRLLKELNVVRWGTIGKARVVVEYGLAADARGELVVPMQSGFPRTCQAIDVRSLRAEAIRGAWCVLDDAGAILNFGLEKGEAEQAVAVCQKYGFNRLGTVGKSPAVTYFFTSLDASHSDVQPRVDASRIRMGLELPGGGFAGEKCAIDARKLEVRREGNTSGLRMGAEILATFGSDEWGARDAVRMIQLERYTEFARVGGATFFLKDGKPPTSVPLHAKSLRFDPASLKTKEQKGIWTIADAGGKQLPAAASEAEANDLIRVVKAFGFDTLATVGNSPTACLHFYVKSR
jgi:hypothetical protein